MVLCIILILDTGNGCLKGSVALYKPLVFTQSGIDLIDIEIYILYSIQELEAQTYSKVLTDLMGVGKRYLGISDAVDIGILNHVVATGETGLHETEEVLGK